MGRPPLTNSKKNETRIRMTDEDAQMLEFCSEKLGITKSEVMRLGVKKIFEELKK